MKNTFAEYIKIVYKIDCKNTFLYMTLNIFASLFIGVETIIIAKLIDNIIVHYKDWKMVFLSFSCLLAAWLLKRMVDYQIGKRGALLRRAINERIPNRIADVKSNISYALLEKPQTQTLIHRIEENGIEQFDSYFENNIFLIVTIMEVGWLLVLIATKAVWIAVCMFMVLLPYIFFSIKNGELSYEAYEKSDEAFRRAEYFQSILKGRKYVEERMIFGYGKFFNEKWKRKFEKAMRYENRANWKIFSRMEVSNIFSTFIIGILFLGIMSMTLSHVVTVGFLISIMKSIINYIDTISLEMAKRVSTYRKGTSYLADITTFFLLDEKKPSHMKEKIDAIHSVEFKDVSFSYPGSDRKVLNHFSLKLENGKQYAIVGENGAGKSTLIKLLMGFYDSYEGEILINGKAIGEYEETDLRSVFSYVPQDVTKYEISLKEYLRTSDRDKIKRVLEEYKVDFLPYLEEGIILGKLEDKAIDLSGGQWQLLAIVRACIHERMIYILDEPTASIDPVKEAELYHTFQNVMKGKFAFLITHRLGAAKMANEIIVIKDGQVAERGTHEKLISMNGSYEKMYELQKRWYE